MEMDFWENGRTVISLGFANATLEEITRFVEEGEL